MSVRERRPTMKQKIFVKEYVESNGNGTRAALKAYDIEKNKSIERVENVAAVIAVENLRKPQIKTLMEEALESVGLTKDKIAKGIEDITKANQPIIFEGEVVSEYPAHDTRLKAFRLSAELIDAFPAKKHENRSAHLNIHVGYSKQELRRLLNGK